MEAKPPPIYVVSGGAGASGEQLVHTALAQFPDNDLPVIVVGNVRRVEQIDPVIAEAKNSGGTIAHTMVDAGLRSELEKQAQAAGVEAIDLMGPLLARHQQFSVSTAAARSIVRMSSLLRRLPLIGKRAVRQRRSHTSPSRHRCWRRPRFQPLLALPPVTYQRVSERARGRG